MTSSNRRTVFNKLWTDKTLFPDVAGWVAEAPGLPFEASCKFCRININLSNMGRQALISHAAGAKHQYYVQCSTNAGQKQCSMTSFLCQPVVKCQPNTPVSVLESMTTSTTATACTVSSPEAATGQNLCVPTCDSKTDKGRSIVGFVINDDVTKAETLWALKCVMSHYSYNSCSDMKDVLKMMFPDSSIANKMSIGSTKLSYYITYGLGPFYHNNLVQAVKTLMICNCY